MPDWRDALELRIDAAGLNPYSVSMAAGLGPTAVRDILSSRSRKPRRQTLRRIGEVLGCTVDELLNPPDNFHEVIGNQILRMSNLVQGTSRPPRSGSFNRVSKTESDG